MKSQYKQAMSYLRYILQPSSEGKTRFAELL